MSTVDRTVRPRSPTSRWNRPADRPAFDGAVSEAPKVTLAEHTSIPMSVNKSAVDPAPLVKEATAPESKPAQPEPQTPPASRHGGLEQGEQNEAGHYPHDAWPARQQGGPWIKFTMDRQRKVISGNLERSSGIRSLDQEALPAPALNGRAKPYRVELLCPQERRLVLHDLLQV